MTFAEADAWRDRFAAVRFPDKSGSWTIRFYQETSVNRVLERIVARQARILLTLATGTGKTLTSAAIIKLFLRTGNARRVLFLVDRLELETQAWKAFDKVLKNDYRCVIYKENRDDWRHAEIVVTTVQSLLFNNKGLA